MCRSRRQTILARPPCRRPCGTWAERVKTIRGFIEQVLVEEERINLKHQRSALLGPELSSGGADQLGNSTIELSVAASYRRRVPKRGWFPGSEQQNRGSRCDRGLLE